LFLVAAACTGSNPDPDIAHLDRASAVPAPSAMPPIRASTAIAPLRAVGLDPAHLPELDADAKNLHALPLDTRKAVMHSIADSLGVSCDGCHAPAAAADAGAPFDFPRWTPKKRTARGMWNHFAKDLVFKDGSPLFCDSCHQGKTAFLDRSDAHALREWMHDNFVGKLMKRDGSALTCSSCHGEPFDPEFVDHWPELASP
jgi:hypothetical protein